MSQANATKLLATDEARNQLPPIRQIAACPIITPEGVLNDGYHPHAGGTLIQAPRKTPEVPLDLALGLFDALLNGFHFASRSDRSRAAAHFISLALKMGGGIPDDYPLFVVEADHSQAGKTYFLRLVATLYNEIPNPIVFAKGGVGSADEAFSTALVRGRLLITFDNVRGKLDSPLAADTAPNSGSSIVRRGRALGVALALKHSAPVPRGCPGQPSARAARLVPHRSVRHST